MRRNEHMVGLDGSANEEAAEREDWEPETAREVLVDKSLKSQLTYLMRSAGAVLTSE